MTAYLAYARCAFLKMLAYRLRYYTGIVTYLVFVSVYYFIWKAVFENQTEGGLINGFTFPEMITYVAIGWIARSFYFSNIDDEVHDIVRSGQVASYLLRPVSFQFLLYFQALGESLFRFLFFSLPIGLVILFLFPVELPVSSSAFLLFLFSTLLGFLVLVAFNFVTGLLAFFFQSIEGIMYAKHNFLMLLSGLLLPLSFFPDGVRTVLEWLPFQAIAYVPLAVYLGKYPPDQLPMVLGLQVMWLVLLFLLGQLMWKRAIQSLVIQGG